MSPRVTIVSTGAMGQAFCRALRARDVSVAAWNRTAARARPLARLGVAVFEDLAPALEGADAVFALTHPRQALSELLFTSSAAARLRGKTLVICSSCDNLAQVHEATAWAAGAEVGYLEAKILAFPRSIGSPAAALLCAGDAPAYEAVQDELRAIGSAVYLGASAPQAAAAEAAAASWFLSAIHTFTSGAALMKAAGGSPLGLFAAVSALWPGLDDYLGALAEQGPAAAAFDPERMGTASIGGMATVLERFVELFEAHGVDAPAAQSVLRSMQAASANGCGDRDMGVFTQVLARPRGGQPR